MKILEVIHLRMAGDDPGSLIELVRTGLDAATDAPDVRIYRHARLEGDLLIHLQRDEAGKQDGFSDLGLRLVSLLRLHGLVEHSVWIQADD